MATESFEQNDYSGPSDTEVRNRESITPGIFRKFIYIKRDLELLDNSNLDMKLPE